MTYYRTTYRTRTYIAGDWEGDKNIIDKIYEWKKSLEHVLDFSDAHELSQSYDSSKPCSIKKNLAYRLDASKTFVLIVGDKTDSLTKGSCRWCDSYDSYHGYCHSNGHIDFRSFVQYECEKAVKDGLRIVVIYNYSEVKRSKCPEIIRYKGTHVNGFFLAQDGKYYWNYDDIKDAIMGV